MTAGSRPGPVVRDWARRYARPFPLDGSDVLPVLPGATTAADVVGLAATVRSAREVVLAEHAILAALAAHAGFRAASIEGTHDTGQALDRYVIDGIGDPERLVRSSQTFLRMRETLHLVHWLRTFNLEHPDDPIHIVHDLRPTTLDRPEQMEEALAQSVLTWHEDTGARIVHLGGVAHAVVGDPRSVPPHTTDPQRNAGAHLRSALGPRYQAIALTTGAGEALFRVPAPPAEFTEAVFGGIDEPAALLDLHADRAPPAEVADWLGRPPRIRCVGPAYDPAQDADHYVMTGPLRQTIDALLHIERITSTTTL